MIMSIVPQMDERFTAGRWSSRTESDGSFTIVTQYGAFLRLNESALYVLNELTPDGSRSAAASSLAKHYGIDSTLASEAVAIVVEKLSIAGLLNPLR